MSAISNYLLKVQERIADDALTQDAVEYAIFTNYVKLTYSLAVDVNAVLERLDEIVIRYKRQLALEAELRPLALDFVALAHDARDNFSGALDFNLAADAISASFGLVRSV